MLTGYKPNMKKEKITTQDILSIGMNESITTKVSDYREYASLKTKVYYARKIHPRNDGLVLYTFLRGDMMTVGLTTPEIRNEIMRSNRIRIKK